MQAPTTKARGFGGKHALHSFLQMVAVWCMVGGVVVMYRVKEEKGGERGVLPPLLVLMLTSGMIERVFYHPLSHVRVHAIAFVTTPPPVALRQELCLDPTTVNPDP
jgi:hypothetical protein